MHLALAYMVDMIAGDPRFLPHPVVIIGRFISFLDRRLHVSGASGQALLRRGLLLTAAVLAATWAAVRILYFLLTFVHPLFRDAVIIFLLSQTLASRSLADAAARVSGPLARGDLAGARQAVGMIVGRDTDSLDETGVARAAVETVAENTVDGVTAPLFYAIIGGLPLAMLYKAVNTMDSMLGYKNERYLFFGRAAARLDDAANYLPARLTAAVMLLSAVLLRLNINGAWRALRRDGRRHPSPNSGLAEAVTAGALNVTLGGENTYGGRVSRRPAIWPEGRAAKERDIRDAVLLMRVCGFLFLLAGLLARVFITRILGGGSAG